MGIKSKVRSMQRGALLRSDEAPVTNADLYRKSPPLLTIAEQSHFKFGNRSVDDLFLEVSDILLACHRSRLAAAEVGKILNKQGLKTACGATWTPRLAWFLMRTWRTIHVQNKQLERQKRQALKQTKTLAQAGKTNDTLIERAVQRQKVDTFQQVLRTYFKNPTLGEIFPELSALKNALQDQLETALPLQADTPADPNLNFAKMTEPLTKGMQPQKSQLVRNKSRFNRPIKQNVPDPDALAVVEFNGSIKDFLNTVRGKRYLASLIRVNPRLLELLGLNDIRFLGSLREKKSPHPRGAYWTQADAEQVRLAILAEKNK